MPGRPHALVGVANLSGMPRSIFDLSRLLNVRSTCDDPYIVLLHVHGEMVGVAVEAVEEVRRLEIDKLMPLDGAADDPARGITKGMTEDHIALLNANSLVEHTLQKPTAQAWEQIALAGATG